jgi:hypothetical protein
LIIIQFVAGRLRRLSLSCRDLKGSRFSGKVRRSEILDFQNAPVAARVFSRPRRAAFDLSKVPETRFVKIQEYK